MAKRRSPRLTRIISPRKTKNLIFFAVLFFGAIYYFGSQASSLNADESTPQKKGCSSFVEGIRKDLGLKSCSALGSKLDVDIEKPYQRSNLTAFPNGKDCANVTLEAIKRDGTFLTDEPLVIEKPDAIKMTGPDNTASGSIKWCFTSTSPIQARITVKLKNLPKVKKTFTINFNPTQRIVDVTDRNRFFFNLPITFTAQLDPAMINGLKEAKLIYTYNRRFNKWGRWKIRREQYIPNLNCTSDGRCTATVISEHTAIKRVHRGTFKYTFLFTDQNGSQFSKTFSGRMKTP